MKVHTLKTPPHLFDRIASGAKTAELRRNDQDFQAGDELELVRHPNITAATPPLLRSMAVLHEPQPTAPHLRFRVTHVLSGVEGLTPGWVMLSLAHPDASKVIGEHAQLDPAGAPGRYSDPVQPDNAEQAKAQLGDPGQQEGNGDA